MSGQPPEGPVAARLSRLAFCLGPALAGALVAGAHPAPAQAVGSLEGSFVWDSIASEDIGIAIEAATAYLSFLHRRFARSHLRATNQPYRTVTIEPEGSLVSITTDGGEPIRAPASGEPIEWTRRDGERMRVRVVREEGAIRQVLVGGGEERENVFRPSADGRELRMVVTVRVDRLPDPIRYELVYRRER